MIVYPGLLFCPTVSISAFPYTDTQTNDLPENRTISLEHLSTAKNYPYGKAVVDMIYHDIIQYYDLCPARRAGGVLHTHIHTPVSSIRPCTDINRHVLVNVYLIPYVHMHALHALHPRTCSP